MTTDTKTGTITGPKLKIYGAGDLNRLRMFEYDGEIGSEITDFGKPYAGWLSKLIFRYQLKTQTGGQNWRSAEL